MRIPQLGMAGVLVIEVNPEDEGIHRARRQFFLDKANELVELAGPRSTDAESADRQDLVQGFVRPQPGRRTRKATREAEGFWSCLSSRVTSGRNALSAALR